MPADGFRNRVSAYERAFIDYPGQEHLGAAKRRNQALLASHLDGVCVRPGETFSVWRLAPRPTAARGYAVAAALKDRRLTSDVGGAICLLSTVLYNAGILAGLDVTERHCHSVDSYGSGRYFELGRDAAIDFAYLDLRFRNPHDFPVRLSVDVDERRVAASFWSATPHGFTVSLAVSEPILTQPPEQVVPDERLAPGARELRTPGLPGLRVATVRTTTFADGRVEVDRLPNSEHHAVPAIIAVGVHAAADVRYPRNSE